MKVIDLLNKIKNFEELPKKFEYNGKVWCLGSDRHYFIGNDYGYDFWVAHGNDKFEDETVILNDEIEILDEEVEILEEEKKIPEKLDMALLGQENNWTQKFNVKTKEMETTGIELNPYILEIITKNTLEIQNRFNQLIDYLKSKGE